MELKLLGTDEHKERFVIFYIDNGEDLNAYLWVYDNGEVWITDIYGLARYCSFSVSPIYVGDDIPEEKVEEAYERLVSLSDEEKKELIDGFNEGIEALKKNEGAYKEKEEYEDGALKDIEEGNNVEDGMFWFM